MGHGTFGVVLKATEKVIIIEDISKNEAEEIVHRHNAFELDGIVDSLLTACDGALHTIKEVLDQYMEHDASGRRNKLPIEKLLETAITNAKRK